MRHRRLPPPPPVQSITEDGMRPAVTPVTQQLPEAEAGPHDAIVAGMVLAQLPDRDIADTILCNGNISTFDGSIVDVDAIAVSGGLVVAAGASSDIIELAGSITDVIDLGGRDWVCWASPRCRGRCEADWN